MLYQCSDGLIIKLNEMQHDVKLLPSLANDLIYLKMQKEMATAIGYFILAETNFLLSFASRTQWN